MVVDSDAARAVHFWRSDCVRTKLRYCAFHLHAFLVLSKAFGVDDLNFAAKDFMVTVSTYLQDVVAVVFAGFARIVYSGLIQSRY